MISRAIRLNKIATRAFVRCNSNLVVTSYDSKYVTVKLDDNRTYQFSNVFLRDSCKSPESVEPHSSQKLFTTPSIVKDLTIKKAPQIVKLNDSNEDTLEIVWHQNGKDHVSHYSWSFLDHYSTRDSRLRGKFFDYDKISWDSKAIQKGLDAGLNVSYEQYLGDKAKFWKIVKALNDYGIGFIDDIPDPSEYVGETMTEDNTNQWPVSKLAEKFGYIKRTFYGALFDVKNVKDAKNIAYTTSFLPLHMDLLYYESPPGLQLLHAIRNSTLGGENIFCDSFLAAKHVRETDPAAYLALTEIPITYHYNNDNEYYYYQRPLIVESEVMDKRSNYPFIKEVNYSPPFQGPFELGITRDSISSTAALENANHFLFNDFIRGLGIFEDFINDPANQLDLKLPEKSCVIFDNRRILHSRNEFSDSNGGDRWLMGCYVDGDSFRSKLRVGNKKFC